MARASSSAGTTIETRTATRRPSAPSGERAAAARALSGRTAVAVLGHRYRRGVDFAAEEVGNMATRLAGDHERYAEHLVEIAVVQIAAVVDRHERAAHDGIEIRR